jgi:hypothetical protein
LRELRIDAFRLLPPQPGVERGEQLDVLVREGLRDRRHDFMPALLFAEEDELDREVGRRVAGQRRRVLQAGVAALAMAPRAGRRLVGDVLGVRRLKEKEGGPDQT